MIYTNNNNNNEKSHSKLPLDLSNPLLIEKYQQIQYLNDKFSIKSSKKLHTCGILSIPPYFDNEFNSLNYYSDCVNIFSPFQVFPIFFDNSTNNMWENFHRIFIQNQQISSSNSISPHYSIFSNIQSFEIVLLQNPNKKRNDDEMMKLLLKYFPSSISRSAYLTKSNQITQIFTELLIHSSFEPIGLILDHPSRSLTSFTDLTSICNSDSDECLYFQLLSLPEINVQNMLTTLRYEMLKISGKVEYKLFTKTKVKKILSLMEITIQILIITLKCLAVGWREMNISNTRNQGRFRFDHNNNNTSNNINNSNNTSNQDISFSLGGKLIVKNSQLLNDILYYQQLCDNAMLSLLIAFQEFQC